MRIPFPDYSQTVTRQLVDGDTVVNFVEIAGTHRGTFFGVPATGRNLQMQALIVTRVEGGKVVEVYALGDELGALLDLGFTLTPPESKPGDSDE
jgi:predicted ester cyclase